MLPAGWLVALVWKIRRLNPSADNLQATLGGNERELQKGCHVDVDVF